MTTNIHKVIGEGSYGCVHKPSLLCDKHTNEKYDYQHKISKLMSPEEAAHEFAEYKIISKIDKNGDFFIGNPIQCKPDKSTENIVAISKCEEGDEFIKNINDEMLLVMTDGGVNLETFSKEIKKMKKSDKTTAFIIRFFVEARRVFYACETLHENNIVHYDLKPQNIVYNKQNNRMNLIDFGFTTYKKNIISESKKSKNWLSSYHWSYPMEINFYNYNKYLEFSNLDKKGKEVYYDSICKYFKNGTNNKATLSMRVFFSYVIDKYASESSKNKIVNRYLQDLKTNIEKNINAEHYEQFLQKSIDTLDIYGIGITFWLLVNSCKHLLRKSMVNDLEELCYSMTNPNLYERYTIEKTKRTYDAILAKYKFI